MTTTRACLTVLSLSVLAACSPRPPGEADKTRPTIFEGARLITGDGSASIEHSVFIVEGDRFTEVGTQGQMAIPPGSNRVDLSG